MAASSNQTAPSAPPATRSSKRTLDDCLEGDARSEDPLDNMPDRAEESAITADNGDTILPPPAEPAPSAPSSAAPSGSPFFQSSRPAAPLPSPAAPSSGRPSSPSPLDKACADLRWMKEDLRVSKIKRACVEASLKESEAKRASEERKFKASEAKRVVADEKLRVALERQKVVEKALGPKGMKRVEAKMKLLADAAVADRKEKEAEAVWKKAKADAARARELAAKEL
ncbi:uncharacterized protein MKK02DRAFT_29073 [Dioszegia hungarica]|uniref:Uncharacterized protein n=1 Tax=Dioszegia hungarica TaxID=4972 RepID=A0AA38H323_9TREE|nr:uncharacterized protein MKK02DRAFT_29073 [Dioszegia hungarica]KAI9633190.1 hypothetical protein MKK02DRAFT_29073 [Dioszegia hungarica]